MKDGCHGKVTTDFKSIIVLREKHIRVPSEYFLFPLKISNASEASHSEFKLCF
jgi:hypothetical protein